MSWGAEAAPITSKDRPVHPTRIMVKAAPKARAGIREAAVLAQAVTLVHQFRFVRAAQPAGT